MTISNKEKFERVSTYFIIAILLFILFRIESLFIEGRFGDWITGLGCFSFVILAFWEIFKK